MDYKNKVELIGIYGSDKTHAQSAWISINREISEEKEKRIDKLLLDLAKNGHGTPFEKSSLHFLITSEISTHIQLLKHRVGFSINSESARYKELKDDKFYIPQDWHNEEQIKLIKHCEESIKKYHECLKRLVESGISRKRAKESARLYLPYSNQITIDLMCNFRSFIHFLELRNSEHAQLEIKNLAQEMLEEVIKTNKFNLSLKAFGWLE